MNINFLVPHLWISDGVKAIIYYAVETLFRSGTIDGAHYRVGQL